MYPDSDMSADEAERRSKELLATVRLVVRPIAVFVDICGILGNVVNMTVLTRKWMRSSTNYYLTMLALQDTLYLFLSIVMFFRTFPAVKLNLFFCNLYPVVRCMANYFSNTGTWLTLTFTAERYIAVRHPMKGRVICTTKRAKWIIAAVCSVSFLCTLPDFFEHKCVYGLVDRKTNATIPPKFAATAYRTMLAKIGYFWINTALFTFIPLLLLAVFNSLLIHSVMQANKARKTMICVDVSTCDARRERHQQEQQRITVMLISVVVVFLICQLPSAIMLLMKSSEIIRKQDLTVRQDNDRRIAGNFTNLLIQINAAINFILYSMFSTKFRKTFKRLFCICVHNRANQTDGLFSEIAAAASNQSAPGARPRASVCTQATSLRATNNADASGSSSAAEMRTGKNGYLKIYGRQEDSV
ncbi:FMRFamide receptor-like [Tubulanus polymorphus]|uniref:FMRFamide receptor-like n=1 Tax=Tubulanus polymorphus TaxID=672921 RepID=UPI003DA63F43